MLLLSSLTALNAMSYEDARQQAWFLTDKMAYELNLTAEQYDRAYEINLDYLMGIRTASDCYGAAWYYRDADLRCIFYDWQYKLYSTLDYFFRPVRWLSGAWYYPITSHYRYGYYYFDRPLIYANYRGGRWHQRRPGMQSPYYGMRPSRGQGMRDRYDERGGHGNGYAGRDSRPDDRNGQTPGRNDDQRNDRRQDNSGNVRFGQNNRNENTTRTGRTERVTTVARPSHNSGFNSSRGNSSTTGRSGLGTVTSTRTGNNRTSSSRQSGTTSQTNRNTVRSGSSQTATRSFGTGSSTRGKSQSVSSSRPTRTQSTGTRSSSGRSFGGRR